MGSMSDIIPQGPNFHCPVQEEHPKHQNYAGPGVPTGTWCDGVPPLMPFLEFVVRVPLLNLVPEPELNDMGYDGTVSLIADEGIPSTVLDYMDSPGASSHLRIRACGKDRIFQVVDGVVQRGKPNEPAE